MNLNSGICIIGAGAAGLSAAHFLKKMGYENITVLEKDDQIGGKCFTVEYEDRTYEIGALMQTTAYKTLLEIMNDVGIKSRRVMSEINVDFEKGSYSVIPSYLKPVNYIPIGLDYIRIIAELLKNRRLLKP